MTEQYATRREARAAARAAEAARRADALDQGDASATPTDAASPAPEGAAPATPATDVPAPEAPEAPVRPDPTDTEFDHDPVLWPVGSAEHVDSAALDQPQAAERVDNEPAPTDETGEFGGIDELAGLFHGDVEIVEADPTADGTDAQATAIAAEATQFGQLLSSDTAAPTSRRARREAERELALLQTVSVDPAEVQDGLIETDEFWLRPARPQLKSIDEPAAVAFRRAPRRSLRAALAVAVTASFVATAALPANATQLQAPTATAPSMHTQSEFVAAGDVLAELESQGYVAQAMGANQDPVDDYPYPGQFGMSSLLYYMGQCVDFVAWRVNRDMGWESGPWLVSWGKGLPPGSAWMWGESWEYGSGEEPLVGSVAWWSSNHVAYVNAVFDDGTIQIEEYNWNGSSAYHVRIIPADSVDLYLYPPSLPEGQVTSSDAAQPSTEG